MKRMSVCSRRRFKKTSEIPRWKGQWDGAQGVLDYDYFSLNEGSLGRDYHELYSMKMYFTYSQFNFEFLHPFLKYSFMFSISQEYSIITRPGQLLPTRSTAKEGVKSDKQHV
jgi:hypothetical protein